MLKKSIIILACFMLMGCGLTLPSVCDQEENEGAVLCKIVKDANEKHGTNIRIEDIGNGFVVANAIAIGQGIYTKEQAASVLDELRRLLEDPVTWAIWIGEVNIKIEKYPGLLEVGQAYFSVLANNYDPIIAADKQILSDWISYQIKILN